MTSIVAGRRPRDLTLRCRRSPTTADIHTLRSPEPASIWPTTSSGRRPVSVFIRPMYYINDSHAIHPTDRYVLRKRHPRGHWPAVVALATSLAKLSMDYRFP